MPIAILCISSLCDLAEGIATTCDIASLVTKREKIKKVTEPHNGPSGRDRHVNRMLQYSASSLVEGWKEAMEVFLGE